MCGTKLPIIILFGGSLKKARKKVAVSMVSFQPNLNLQRVQLTFGKNNSYFTVYIRGARYITNFNGRFTKA